MQANAMFESYGRQLVDGVNRSIGVVASRRDESNGVAIDLTANKINVDQRRVRVNRRMDHLHAEHPRPFFKSRMGVVGKMISGMKIPRSDRPISR